jgi:hypothetical protein
MYHDMQVWLFITKFSYRDTIEFSGTCGDTFRCNDVSSFVYLLRGHDVASASIVIVLQQKHVQTRLGVLEYSIAVYING